MTSGTSGYQNTPASLTRPQALAALREMVRSLSGAWDLDSTLDLIARKTTEVMHVDSCSIYLLDPDGESLRLQASTGLSRRALGRSTLRIGEGMTGYAAAQNLPIHATEARQSPHFKLVEETDESGFSSLLAVPLVMEDQTIGALNVQTVAPHSFSDDEIEILSLIGDLAASSLARAQLYDRQRQQIAEMRTLAQVSETVTSPIYLDEMLEIVSEMAGQIMDTADCHIYLLDEDGTTLQRRSGRNGRSAASPHLTLASGPISHVAGGGDPLYIADIRETGEALEDRDAALAAGFVSLLAVPLSVRDRVIGVLTCFTTNQREFSEEERTILLTLANQTALAIENAQLITNTAVVREMHHRIKNNLQTVAMLMQLQIHETDNKATRHALETNINRIRSIASVHEVLSERGFHLVDVKEVLEQITLITSSNSVRPEQDIRISVHGESIELPSRAATSLALVCNELVQNALEHAFTGQTEGAIEISLGRSPDEFIILVRDSGHGLPQTFQNNLGLDIAETLVRDDLHGQIKFNRPPQGAEISIRIPRWLELER